MVVLSYPMKKVPHGEPNAHEIARRDEVAPKGVMVICREDCRRPFSLLLHCQAVVATRDRNRRLHRETPLSYQERRRRNQVHLHRRCGHRNGSAMKPRGCPVLEIRCCDTILHMPLRAERRRILIGRCGAPTLPTGGALRRWEYCPTTQNGSDIWSRCTIYMPGWTSTGPPGQGSGRTDWTTLQRHRSTR